MGLTKKLAGNGKKAFTLMELLISISLISILASLTYVGVNAVRKSAKRNSSRMLLNQLYFAGQQYKEDLGRFPPTDDLDPSNTSEVMKEFTDREYIRTKERHYDKKGNFIDSYGYPVRMSTEPQANPWDKRKYFNVWSIGNNNKDEKGKGDDVTSGTGVLE